VWHILLPIQIMSIYTYSNIIISCSIILTNRTLLFGASLCTMFALLYVGISKNISCSFNRGQMKKHVWGLVWQFVWVGVGGLLINSNAGYICWAELRKEPYVQLQECKFPHLEDGLLIILFQLLLLHLEFWKQGPLFLSTSYTGPKKEINQLWFTRQSSLYSFEVRFVLNVMGMSHFKIWGNDIR